MQRSSLGKLGNGPFRPGVSRVTLRTMSAGEWWPVPSGALLVAAVGGKFHMPDCDWALEIIHAVYYVSCQDAMDDGFPACRTCKPRRRHPEVIRHVPKAWIDEAASRIRAREQRELQLHAVSANPLRVTLQFGDGEVESFHLVSSGRGDGKARISVDTPLGTAILGAKVGSQVSYYSPAGNLEQVLILEVEESS